MNSLKRRAATLVEILIVTAIIAVLIGVTWLAVGPASKARALEAQCRGNLRSLAQAVNVYMADNNDLPPLSLEALPGSVATACPQFHLPYSYFGGLLFQARKTEGPSYDISMGKVAVCYSHNSHKGETLAEKHFLKDGTVVYKQVPVLTEGEDLRCLTALLDGSVALRSVNDPTLIGYADIPQGVGATKPK